jgi:hypothetical protein
MPDRRCSRGEVSPSAPKLLLAIPFWQVRPTRPSGSSMACPDLNDSRLDRMEE